MPLLTELGALFIHIPKNAGRSVEAALLGEDLKYDSGRRGLINGLFRKGLKLSEDRIPARHLMGTLDVTLAAQHLTLAEISLLGLVPDDQLKTLFKFCIVRNPFDRAISSLHHVNPKLSAHIEPVEKALHSWLTSEPGDHNLLAHRRPQNAFIRNPLGEIDVDLVMRFESLEADFEKLKSRLGVRNVSLPKVGQKTQVSYRDLYSDYAKQLVEDAFSDDLEEFGYSF